MYPVGETPARQRGLKPRFPLHLHPGQQRSPRALAQHHLPRAASQLRVLGASPCGGGLK